jgi:copper chaperone CopZ
MAKSSFQISGVNCDACIKLLRMELPESIQGIEKIDVDLKGKLEITADHEISKQELASALVNTDHKII